MKRIQTALIALAILTVGLSVSAYADDSRIESIVAAVYKNGECSETGSDVEETRQRYSLYREDFKNKDYKSAIDNWRYVFFNAPKLREQIFKDGATMFDKLARETKDPEERAACVDTMLAIYDVRIKCWGASGDLLGRKAYAWYTFRSKKDAKGIYELINTIYDDEEMRYNMLYNMLLPWANVVVHLHQVDKSIEVEEVLENYEKMLSIADHHNKERKHKKWQQYIAFKNKGEEVYKENGYLSCENLVGIAEKYFKKYEADNEDMRSLAKAYTMLRAGECTDAPFFLTVLTKLNEENPDPARYMFISVYNQKKSDLKAAIENMDKAIEIQEDTEKLADYYLRLAKLHQTNGSFSSARTAARKALENRPNWGDPYLLIGKLYASSGKLCGPGTGWDSQVVAWAAVDKFYKAKSVDPEVAEEANKLIGKYSAFFPKKSDGFMKNVNEGDSYKVECWIQESTTARFAG